MKHELVSTVPVSLIDPKQFYRRVEMIFGEVNTFGGTELFARSFLSRFQRHLGESLGIEAAHLYDASAGLICTWGEYVPDLSEELEKFQEQRVELPWTGVLARRLAAVLPVADDSSMLAILLMEPMPHHGPDPTRIQTLASVFSSLHYALIQNLRRLELQDVFEQARAIQMSLLPSAPPAFSDFQIAAVSVPARSVGGDIYDYHAISPGALAVALGDASGHGFPAALQARDVMTGLRMGWDPEMDLVPTVEKLNTVIHRSGLGSRFVSLVVGMLRADGVLRYINAGHPPPLLLDDDGFQELAPSGMILGPFPWTRYREDVAHLAPGSLLLLYSDGVVEHSGPLSEFGRTRLERWMEDWRQGPAEAAITDLFQRLRDFGDNRPFQDDATVMLIHRNY